MPWPPRIGEPLPRAGEAWCDRVKLEDWVLGVEGHGSEWSRVFRVDSGDWELVWRTIAEATLEVVCDRSPFGIACGVEVGLTINGRTAPVILSWHYAGEGAAPRLVTAYLTL